MNEERLKGGLRCVLGDLEFAIHEVNRIKTPPGTRLRYVNAGLMCGNDHLRGIIKAHEQSLKTSPKV